MARRRRSDPLLQKVRQLARQGKRAAAGELLENALKQNPNHAKAREEYLRFANNQPFTFEEKDYAELQNMISSFLSTPQMLTTMRSAALRKLRQRASHLQKAQEHMLSAMEKKTISQLRSNIARELQRRRKPLGKIATIAGSVLIVLLLISAGVFFLWKRAQNAAVLLDNASKDHISRTAAINLLNIHDTGLNRTLNRRVSLEADNLRAYIMMQGKRMQELDAILRVIESGKQSVVGQGVRRRAGIERKLKDLGQDARQLQIRWAALCEAEKEALNQQRLTLSEELQAPLPVAPPLTGDLIEDISGINRINKTLLQRINIYEDAKGPLELGPEKIEPVQKAYEKNLALLKEMKAWQNMLQLLPSARDYETFRERISSCKTDLYSFASELQSICSQMPKEGDLKVLMQEEGQNVKPGMLVAARKTLMEGAPSFCKEFPANQKQLHILEELLNNQVLNSRLYEHIDTYTKERAISSELPVIRMGRACFPRSAYDPKRRIEDEKEIEWHNPDDIVTRTLDPTPLFTGLGLSNRAGFFSTVNLPEMITDIFQLEGRNIPALARAYVLHYTIKALHTAEAPLLNGLRYAPETKKTLDEFEKLRKACDVRLDGTCWLQYTHKHVTAEARYAHWFNKHKTLNFQKEVRKNLGKLMKVSPRFCGYVNEHKQTVVFQEIKEGQIVWYLAEDGSIATGRWGSPLQAPRPLSPIFTREKQL